MSIERDIETIQKQFNQPESVTGSSPQFGISVVDIERVEQRLTNKPADYELLFTPVERAYCRDRISSYAGRFAGKQAVTDVFRQSVSWRGITIDRDQSGKPYVELADDALRLAEEQGVCSIPISISHDGGFAVGFAVGITNPDVRVALGTDVSSVERVERVYRKLGAHFLRRVFSEAESSEAGTDVVRLTEMWAGKEAVAKVLGTGVWGAGVAWTDISILSEADNRFSISLDGNAREQADNLGFSDWQIYILRQSNNPIAFVSAVGSPV